MANEMVLVRATYGDEGVAKEAARMLVERRLAACVHVQSVWSVYRWQGKMEAGTEWMVEARTTPAARDACWGALLDGHPDETPLVEILAQTQVPARYAEWAASSVRPPT